MIKTLIKDIATLCQEAWSILSTRASLWWLLLLLPLFAMIPFDSFALDNWRFADNTPANKAAQLISQRGDFYNGCFILVAVLFIIGLATKKKALQLLALAMLLSCAAAGVSSLAVRIASGRPRPSLGVADGLYGPQFKPHKGGFMFFDYNYQSFPSGHATTAFATAAPALVMVPVIGVPLAGAAVAVTWARFQLNRHHPSDLYMGLLIGCVFGTIFGLAAKRKSRNTTKAK